MLRRTPVQGAPFLFSSSGLSGLKPVWDVQPRCTPAAPLFLPPGCCCPAAEQLPDRPRCAPPPCPQGLLARTCGHALGARLPLTRLLANLVFPASLLAYAHLFADGVLTLGVASRVGAARWPLACRSGRVQARAGAWRAPRACGHILRADSRPAWAGALAAQRR